MPNVSNAEKYCAYYVAVIGRIRIRFRVRLWVRLSLGSA